MGRYLNGEYPNYLDNLPNDPPAVVIGNRSDLTFFNCDGDNMGLTFSDVNSFSNFVSNNGILYSNSGIGNTCAADIERRFLRSIGNSLNQYGNSVYNSFLNGGTYAYNTSTELSNRLNIVARLIKGGLNTRVYLVDLGGFDFHGGQMNNHQALLGDVANSVKDFFDDLTSTGHQQKVLTMAYSEFGRTIVGNDIGGTDHGTLNNVMMFGEGLNGGFHGTPMNLNDPSIPSQHRVFYESTYQQTIDFRTIYSTVLKDWLNVNVVDPSCPTNDSGYIPDLFHGVLNPGCPVTEVLYNGLDDYNNQNGTIQAQNSVIAHNVIGGTSAIKYDAGLNIKLEGDFEVKQGADFEAIIGGCNPVNAKNSDGESDNEDLSKRLVKSKQQLKEMMNKRR